MPTHIHASHPPGMRSPSAVTRPSPQVYMKALILGSTTCAAGGRREARQAGHAAISSQQCEAAAAAAARLPAGLSCWPAGCTRLPLETHPPTRARQMLPPLSPDSQAKQSREKVRAGQPTCVRRMSATRNMNFRMPSRRATIAESEMKIDRLRCLGWEMRLRGGGGGWICGTARFVLHCQVPTATSTSIQSTAAAAAHAKTMPMTIDSSRRATMI
jgi:hypothetical protein